MKIKAMLSIIGWTGLIAPAIVFYLTWFYALLNGGSVLISINSFGEQWIELFLIVLSVPCAAYLLVTKLTRVEVKPQETSG